MRALRVTVAAADEDDAVVCLWEHGTAGIEVQSGAPGEAVLLAYFEAAPSDELAAALAALPGARIEAAAVPEVDWLARFREGFTSLVVGSFLIAPAWDAPEPKPGQRRLLCDPGRAFGTGTHESTQLCLLVLDQLSTGPALGRVLDLGTGAGILAVAAALCGAEPVIATDVDPEAIMVAAKHARLNRVRLHLACGDGGRPLRAHAFDLVFANVQATFLIPRAAEISSLCAPGGVLVLSGLLVSDVPEVSEAYAGLGSPRVLERGEWAALVFGRAPA